MVTFEFMLLCFVSLPVSLSSLLLLLLYLCYSLPVLLSSILSLLLSKKSIICENYVAVGAAVSGF